VREAYTHIRADYTVDQVVTVENNSSYGDSYVSGRDSYTGVSAVPVKKVDVIHSALGGGGTWQTHYDWIKGFVDSDGLISAPGTIDITYDQDGNSVTMHATLTLDTAISGDYRMWQVFTENNPSAPDNNPHYYVRTGILGTLASQQVTITSPGQSQTFDWTFNLQGGWTWTYDHYGAAFLEKNDSSKEVVQAKQIEMPVDFDPYLKVEPASLGQVKSLYH
jgi:hypothetical protein